MKKREEKKRKEKVFITVLQIGLVAEAGPEPVRKNAYLHTRFAYENFEM